MADRTNPDDITHQRCHAARRPEYKQTVGFFTRHGQPRATSARHACFNAETCGAARYRGVRDAQMPFPFAFKGLPIRPARARQMRHVSFLRLPLGPHSGWPVVPDIRSRSQTHAPARTRANSFRRGVKNPDKAPFRNVSNVIGRFFFGAGQRRAPARADRVIDWHEDSGRRTRRNGDARPAAVQHTEPNGLGELRRVVRRSGIAAITGRDIERAPYDAYLPDTLARLMTDAGRRLPSIATAYRRIRSLACSARSSGRGSAGRFTFHRDVPVASACASGRITSYTACSHHATVCGNEASRSMNGTSTHPPVALPIASRPSSIVAGRTT